MLARRWFTNDGPYVVELERRLEDHLGVRHCVTANSGSAAMLLAIRGLDLSGEVIVPSFTFVGTAHSVAWMGLKPVFCDIDRATWNIDPTACEAAVTPNTSAILGVHLFGRGCNAAALKRIATSHDLRLVFDAAHAFGCSLEGRRVGGFGDAEVFSFHATKSFHTFEGGAVTTDDDVLASKLRAFRSHGISDLDRTIGLGTNARMSEVCAAMGLANLDSYEATLKASHTVHQAYERGLEAVPGLDLRESAINEESNWHYVVAEVEEAECGLSRDSLIEVLRSNNVLARRYFYPGCHALEPYVTEQPDAGRLLPETERAAARSILFPAGSSMAPEDVDRVCALVRDLVGCSS